MAHLTNNCVVQKFVASEKKKKKNSPKKLDNEGSSDEGEDEEEEPENIQSLQDFSLFLKKQFPERTEEDIFKEVIFPQIAQAVRASTLSVQDMVDNRKNCFEFFGYDLMVDEHLRVWLIEVNSSPSMDTYNIPILKELVKAVLRDLAKVVIDYPKNKKAETGGFLLVHKAPHEITRPTGNMSCDLRVEGYGIDFPQIPTVPTSHSLASQVISHKPYALSMKGSTLNQLGRGPLPAFSQQSSHLFS